ncbi:hypothetical protein KR093_001425 [Drosophila rubida]|uniref:Uncharacterized protein n=1 Tax=Drosophila rubida TaxID=30044 RepID=A0AAD4JXE0_9MUSC|nr:hypothetical protein KR093_001425 [Drosophila rubida]
MASKKITPENRPFCDPRLEDAKYRRRRFVPPRLSRESTKKTGKRPLNDCPFFDLKYEFDELPLDPVKDFLLEKISHLQNDTIVGRCNREFDFHKYDLENVKDEYEPCEDDILEHLKLTDIVMPEKFEALRKGQHQKYNFDKMVRPSETEIHIMTNYLLDLYCKRRVRIFYVNCGTKSAMFTNKLRRQYGPPSELIGAYNTPTARHLRVTGLNQTTKKETFKAGDHYALRTPQGEPQHPAK